MLQTATDHHFFTLASATKVIFAAFSRLKNCLLRSLSQRNVLEETKSRSESYSVIKPHAKIHGTKQTKNVKKKMAHEKT